MLAHLKFIWQLHAVHQKVSRFFGPKHYKSTQDFVIVESNMKPARPCMLEHLKIIWQFHQKVSRFFGPRYIGDDFFFRAESSRHK
jgi:hypothetical protein